MTKPIYILGIHDGHCATASLLKNGEIISSVSEERFLAIKNYIGFPYKAIDYLLKSEGITGKDLAMVVLPLRWGLPVFSENVVLNNDPILKLANALYIPLGSVRSLWGSLEYQFPILNNLARPLYRIAFRLICGKTISEKKKFIAKYLKIDVSKINNYEHHASHAAAAYYASSFNHEDALVLSIDGEGDLLCASVSTVRNGEWERLAETTANASLGLVYQEVTGYLGMKRGEHEYKVMGLAPYAKDYGVSPVFRKIKDLIILDPYNPLRFKSKFDVHYISKFLHTKMKEQRFDYIAGAFQKLTEDRICEWVKAAIKQTGLTTVCIGGGVAMNVKANLKISEISELRKFFPCPSAGDESTQIGACYLGYMDYCRQNKIVPNIKSLGSLYLGPSFTNTQIKEFLMKNHYFSKYKIKYVGEIEKEIAQLLASNKIVANLAGRMEWGARALGNRSILANPSNIDTVRIINDQMKMRDFWMPFTPSILKERGKKYVINFKNILAPYMIMTFNSTITAQKQINAAIHPSDFTVRPQLVDKDWNPRYHKIISEFEKLSGIGAVLNTSFNLHGLPIVLGPQEAIHAFENSGLEYLVLENYLICKNSSQ
ncbi:MAG: Carbamoyl transferase [Candidatus Amesbacteria bacterium GW2011_GWA2_47_11b]|nr:MAG: Carbamoyl transferase [Microgenomates group bacterium GW2011_GWC1_46_20]KKU58499.1 MAG: Carbamoyl transferase [Candidatus Amesbacteria bacterium GW2011_GWA2_47_11b]